MCPSGNQEGNGTFPLSAPEIKEAIGLTAGGRIAGSGSGHSLTQPASRCMLETVGHPMELNEAAVSTAAMAIPVAVAMSETGSEQRQPVQQQQQQQQQHPNVARNGAPPPPGANCDDANRACRPEFAGKEVSRPSSPGKKGLTHRCPSVPTLSEVAKASFGFFEQKRGSRSCSAPSPRRSMSAPPVPPTASTAETCMIAVHATASTARVLTPTQQPTAASLGAQAPCAARSCAVRSPMPELPLSPTVLPEARKALPMARQQQPPQPPQPQPPPQPQLQRSVYPQPYEELQPYAYPYAPSPSRMPALPVINMSVPSPMRIASLESLETYACRSTASTPPMWRIDGFEGGVAPGSPQSWRSSPILGRTRSYDEERDGAIGIA